MRNRSLVIFLWAVISLVLDCEKRDCRTSLNFAVPSPHGQETLTLYTKQCGTINRGVAEKQSFIVTIRPILEPPPKDNRFPDSDVIFEIEGTPKVGLGGSPSSFALFSYLPKDERETSILIECQECDRNKIRKQAHRWKGIPVHYYFPDPSGTNPTVE